jgi:hypothetical protein
MFRTLKKIFFPKYIGKGYGPVRYAFPLVIITALFAGLASVVTENGSYVTIRTNATSVTRDQQFIVVVLVTAHVPVNAVDLVISYPSERIRIDSIDTGTSVITLWAEEPYARSGSIYLRGGTFRKGFIGEHTIARIKATAVESGDAHIFVKDTQLVAGDGKGTTVDVTSSATREAQITVMGADGVITGEATITIVTDTDGDGDVDIGDISAFMVAWFTKGNMYDFNGDGKMTIRDFSILLADSFFR